MRRFLVPCLLAPGILFLARSAGAADRRSFDAFADREALSGIESRPVRSICSETSNPASMRCFAQIVVGDDGIFTPATAPEGYGPQDLQAAYLLPTTGGDGSLIAAVDAYDYPNAEADLAVYRAQFGLPPCTTANGCFRKVDQNGGTNLPQVDPKGGCSVGWSGEASLDLQMLSAGCPDCRLLLVEADAPDHSLQTALATAARLGAVAISNSYGGAENAKGDDVASEPVYARPGILITVSAGDAGFGPAYPATSAGVVAVGATTLKRSSSSRGWAESAWKGSGSGCSAEIAKPAWQTDPSCANRMEADVAAIGNPSTGVATYCTDLGPGPTGGWGVVGGTSVSAPLIAGAFTVLKLPRDPSFAWSNPSLFYDVTSGTNGTCATSYFCNAGTGYDGPTGWGTPNGALLAAKSQVGTGAETGKGESPGAATPPVADAGETSGNPGALAASGGGAAGSGAGTLHSSGDGGTGLGEDTGATSGFQPTSPVGGCRTTTAPLGDGTAVGIAVGIAVSLRRRKRARAGAA